MKWKCRLLGHHWDYRLSNVMIPQLVSLKRDCRRCGKTSRFLIFPSGRGEWQA